MSAQLRRITQLEQHIVGLERMQMEYNLLLNYLVEFHEDVDNPGDEKVFTIHTAKLKKIKPGPILTTITDNGQKMEIRRVNPSANGERSLIIKP